MSKDSDPSSKFGRDQRDATPPADPHLPPWLPRELRRESERGKIASYRDRLRGKSNSQS